MHSVEGTYLPSQGFELGIELGFELGIRARNSSSEFELGIRARILVRLNLLRNILRIICLALVYEEQYGEAASCLQSLSKQLKRMEAQNAK